MISGFARSVLLGLVLLGAAPAAAQQDESEEEAIYSRYHMAMEVAKQCRKLTYDEQDHNNMAEVINDKINNAIGAKRLRLLTAAQRAGRALVEDQGCDNPEAEDLLEVVPLCWTVWRLV